MGFKDRLKSAVQESGNYADSFSAEWTRLRPVIRGLFQDAINDSLAESMDEATTSLRNDEVSLSLKNNGVYYELVFRADRDKMIILCESNVNAINDEPFNAGRLAEPQIVEKIIEFASQARKGATKRAGGWEYTTG